MTVEDKEIYIKMSKSVDVLVKTIERFHLEQSAYYEYATPMEIKEV